MNANPQIVNGRYLILGEVGAGGMGTVYRARDLLNGQQIALKQVNVGAGIAREDTLVISTSNTTNLNVVLAHEFKVLASLRHPHIISVLDYGFDETEPYFTMPLLDEPRDLIEAAHYADTNLKIDLLTELLQALTYLHRRGVVHRDLKPSNVLVTPQDHIQLVDFGLATMTHQTADSSGTIAYMAPEIIQGGVPTEATDLFGVGLMAYEMFSNSHPFYDENMTVMINRILFEEVDLSLLQLARYY